MPSKFSKLRLKAFQNQKGFCFYCNWPMWLTDKAGFATKHSISLADAERFKCTAEHLVARCDGGNDTATNIVAACRFCNEHRHRRKTPPDPENYLRLIQKQIRKGKWHPESVKHLLAMLA